MYMLKNDFCQNEGRQNAGVYQIIDRHFDDAERSTYVEEMSSRPQDARLIGRFGKILGALSSVTTVVTSDAQM